MKITDHLSFEKKILHASLIVILILAVYVVFHGVTFGSTLPVLAMAVVMMLFYATLYYLLTVKKIVQPLALLIIGSTYLFLIIFWILTGGSYSTVPLSYQLCMLGAITIAHPKYRLCVIIIFIVTAVILSFLNFIFGDTIVPQPNQGTVNAVPVIFIITLTGIAYIAYSLKYNFDLERRAIREQNDELAEKNKIISEQNEEINQINQTLDQKVQERTRLLEEQNKQLIQYAFYNAHKVRGPLCRILGLVHLARPEYETDKDFIIKKIEESAKELELITKAINDILQDKNFGS